MRICIAGLPQRRDETRVVTYLQIRLASPPQILEGPRISSQVHPNRSIPAMSQLPTSLLLGLLRRELCLALSIRSPPTDAVCSLVASKATCGAHIELSRGLVARDTVTILRPVLEFIFVHSGVLLQVLVGDGLAGLGVLVAMVEGLLALILVCGVLRGHFGW